MVSITKELHISVILIWFVASPTNGLPYPWEEPSTQIRLYMADEWQKKTWRAEDLTNGEELFHDPSYDPLKPTLLITHGWFQGAEDSIIVMLLDSMFEVKLHHKMNIMVLDAPYFLDSIISNISYFAPARNIEMLGNIVGDIFNKAISQELVKPENINLVGLSLGAHLSGYIGRATMGQVHSIVGLDPAGPGFDSTLQYLTKLQHVSKLDAQFVHLYHTNSVTFGTTQRLGTADFEFNQGFSQPGCATSIAAGDGTSGFSLRPKNVAWLLYMDTLSVEWTAFSSQQMDTKCSHKRAFYIFNDLILGDKELIALRCDTQKQFKNCYCRKNSSVVLQYPIDTSAEGIYFLQTTYKAPFGLGEEGITCWKDQWESLQKEKEMEKSKTAGALMTITDKFKMNMAFLQKKENYLAIFRPQSSSEEGQ